MNQVIRDLWVEALRCGKYIQGTGPLRSKPSGGEDRYCVYGVLCDMYDKCHHEDNWVDTKDPRMITGDSIYYHKDGSRLLPADCIREWAELGWYNVNVKAIPPGKTKGTMISLSQLNDGSEFAPLSFEQLALLIEEQL